MKTNNLKTRTLFIISFLILLTTASNAQITFVKSSQLLGELRGACAASGDIDNDGDIDLIIGHTIWCGNDTNRVWLNEGDGSFVLSKQFIGTDGEAVKLADFNGDNYLDIVFSHLDNTWIDMPNTIWINQGDGTFEQSVQSIGGRANSPTHIQIIDFNGDSFPDIIFDYSVVLNDGQGNFTQLESKVIEDDIRNFTLGDLDNDGDLDAIATYDVIIDGVNPAEGKPCKVFFNDGANNFTLDNSQNISNSNTLKVLLGDLNGDNTLDAFVSNFHLYNTGERDDVWFNNGNGNFTRGVFSVLRKVTFDAELIDIDKDGDLDIYTGYTEDQNNYIWLNNGTGRFTGLRTEILTTSGVEINDFNGDGAYDILTLFVEGNSIWVQNKPTAVNDNLANNQPTAFELKQNYPNPFNPHTTINYSLQKSAHVSLTIYNIAGQEIERLVDGFQAAGKHQRLWQPKNLPSGTYFCQLQADGFTSIRKLILQK